MEENPRKFSDVPSVCSTPPGTAEVKHLSGRRAQSIPLTRSSGHPSALTSGEIIRVKACQTPLTDMLGCGLFFPNAALPAAGVCWDACLQAAGLYWISQRPVCADRRFQALAWQLSKTIVPGAFVVFDMIF